LILLITPQSRDRLFSIFDSNQNSSRIKIWKLTEIMIKHKPFTGLGYGNFTLRYKDYIDSNPTYLIGESYTPLHPHNILLKFQSELGILGTILLLIFTILTLYTLYKNIKNCNNSITKSILIGIMISFILFNFMNIIDCYYDTLKVITSMFILLGFSNMYSKNRYLN
ncbi:O-antigen ligase family protein, partial [Clostridium sp.]|uniref:O-antigen ligase family protein n=1 Tax=Clostridium sp. TaxID=1506 RepID=UPI00262C6768